MNKILQIIPAPAGLEALFEVKEGEGIGIPVACLALVEDSDKRREVRPMCAAACGSRVCGRTRKLRRSFYGVILWGNQAREKAAPGNWSLCVFYRRTASPPSRGRL